MAISEIEGGIRVYLREIGKTDLLTPDQEVELAEKIRRGDGEARSHMIRANLRLVVKIAQDYANYGLPLLDLISEGNIGLMKAVERFDPNKGGKLSTYASWWIKQSIKRALANQSKTIRLPVHMVDKISKMRRIAMAMSEELGREPTDDELSEEIGIGRAKLAQLKIASMRPASLDAPISYDDSTEFGEIVGDENAEDPFEALSHSNMRGQISGLLTVLDERERKIIDARFGLNNQKPRTLEEVGTEFGVTRERIRQLQNIALRKLRRALQKKEDDKLIALEKTANGNKQRSRTTTKRADVTPFDGPINGTHSSSDTAHSYQSELMQKADPPKVSHARSEKISFVVENQQQYDNYIDLLARDAQKNQRGVASLLADFHVTRLTSTLGSFQFSVRRKDKEQEEHNVNWYFLLCQMIPFRFPAAPPKADKYTCILFHGILKDIITRIGILSTGSSPSSGNPPAEPVQHESNGKTSSFPPIHLQKGPIRGAETYGPYRRALMRDLGISDKKSTLRARYGGYLEVAQKMKKKGNELRTWYEASCESLAIELKNLPVEQVFLPGAGGAAVQAMWYDLVAPMAEFGNTDTAEPVPASSEQCFALVAGLLGIKYEIPEKVDLDGTENSDVQDLYLPRMIKRQSEYIGLEALSREDLTEMNQKRQLTKLLETDFPSGGFTEALKKVFLPHIYFDGGKEKINWHDVINMLLKYLYKDQKQDFRELAFYTALENLIAGKDINLGMRTNSLFVSPTSSYPPPQHDPNEPKNKQILLYHLGRVVHAVRNLEEIGSYVDMSGHQVLQRLYWMEQISFALAVNILFHGKRGLKKKFDIFSIAELLSSDEGKVKAVLKDRKL